MTPGKPEKHFRSREEVERLASRPVPALGPFSLGERVVVTKGPKKLVGSEGHVLIERAEDDELELKVVLDHQETPISVDATAIRPASGDLR